MSTQGWKLENIRLFIYTFSNTVPNEYTYRLQYIDDKRRNVEEYKSLLEEDGITVSRKRNNFYYLVKKGDFNIFYDNESMISYLKKMRKYYIGLLAAFIPVVIVFLKNYLTMDYYNELFVTVPLFLGSFLLSSPFLDYIR